MAAAVAYRSSHNLVVKADTPAADNWLAAGNPAADNWQAVAGTLAAANWQVGMPEPLDYNLRGKLLAPSLQ